MSGFWNTLKTFMQMAIYFYTSFILIARYNIRTFGVLREENELVFIAFWHFSNYLQVPSKYSKSILSICKISLKKYNMLEADEDGRMLFLLWYIFKCKWNRETGHMLTKISNFVQFSNKKDLLQWLNIMMKRQKYRMATLLNYRAIFSQIWKQ